MKIHFTKNEYRLLLDMISISDWVMNANCTGENPQSQPYEQLEQKILTYAKDFGFENLVRYEKQFNKYYPTREYEDLGTDRAFIEEFETNVFWDELCNRLAQRDLLKAKGIEKLKEMTTIERLEAEDETADKYNNVFIEIGFKNLVISNK